MKLGELADKQMLIRKMYEGITDYDRVMEIVPLIDEIEKHLKAYDKNVAELKEQAKTEPQQADKKFLELREKDTKIKLVKVTKEEIKKAGFNVFEYRAIQSYIKQ